jgi:hypothetical protein
MPQKPADPACLEAKFALHDPLVDHGVASSSGPADSQRAGAQKESAGNYFPTLISTAYTSITLVPTLSRGNAVLAALRLVWEERPGRYSDLF